MVSVFCVFVRRIKHGVQVSCFWRSRGGLCVCVCISASPLHSLRRERAGSRWEVFALNMWRRCGSGWFVLGMGGGCMMSLFTLWCPLTVGWEVAWCVDRCRKLDQCLVFGRLCLVFYVVWRRCTSVEINSCRSTSPKHLSTLFWNATQLDVGRCCLRSAWLWDAHSTHAKGGVKWGFFHSSEPPKCCIHPWPDFQ